MTVWLVYTMNQDMKLFTVSFRNQDKLFIRACMVQWNLVNTNTVKAKSLLNTNHFEIPRHYNTNTTSPFNVNIL